MAVKSSGSLSLTTDIIGEFGGDVPHSLSEYYGGGTYVPAGANPGVATSGTINMGSFYDTVAATVLTITSNTNNYDIGAAAIAAGGDKNTPVILTINSGVTVGSTSSSTPAMYTGTGWGSGTTINITNNGSIVGASGSNTSGYMSNGGKGGNSRYDGNAYSGNSGSAGSGSADSANNGGNAFEHSQTADNNLSVIFDIAGTRTGGSAGTKTIYGGGGGGGGGGYGYHCQYQGHYAYGGAGGGGGAGYGARGDRSGVRPGNSGNPGNHGSAGGQSTGGSGGARVSGTGGAQGGAGGNGGNSGSSGGSGEQGKEYCSYWGLRNSYGGGSGGSGGANGTANGTVGSALSGNTGQIS